MKKTLLTLLVGTIVSLLSSAVAKADCVTIGKATSAGTLAGEVCVDMAAGTIHISGVVTLPDGSERTIEADATIKGSRRSGHGLTTAAGTVTISNGTDVTTVSLTVTDGSIVLALQTFTGKVINLALP